MKLPPSSPRTSCCRTIGRSSCITATPATCRSSTTTAICRRPQIAEDRRFENLTQIWLARRSLQVAGDAGGRRGRTLLHRRRLGLGEVPEVGRDRAANAAQSALPLDAPGTEAAAWASATGCWVPTRPRASGDECNAKLAQPEFSCRGIMRQMNVVLVCTTDDPTDTLEHHRAIAADASFPIQVLPTFRPDKAMAVGIAGGVQRLGRPAGRGERRRHRRRFRPLSRRLAAAARFLPRRRLPALRPRPRDVLRRRLHARRKSRPIFRRVRAAARRSRPTRSLKFKSAMLYELAVMDHEKGWAQQFHFGALRNNNTRMFQALGPGHRLRLDRRLSRSPGRWRGSSTGWTATAGWPRRSSTTSIRPTTKWWPR